MFEFEFVLFEVGFDVLVWFFGIGVWGYCVVLVWCCFYYFEYVFGIGLLVGG